jgi:hypothetical protein
MAIPAAGRYHYHTVVHADRDGVWSGTADDDGSPSLLGCRPSVVVTNGRVTMTRRWSEILTQSTASTASFDAGEALRAVLRDGDRLACWRTGTGEIGVSVTRAGSLVLGLGTLGEAPGGDITIDHDPRVEEVKLARELRYLDLPGTQCVWLDPQRPSELASRLRELDGDCSGVDRLGIVVRSDDIAVVRELNRRTMWRPRPGHSRMFLRAAERFSTLEEWLHYGRALSTERPHDLWLRIRRGSREGLVPEGRTATFDGWLVHVLRVHEPGIPGFLSQLGLVQTDTGVTQSVLERSTSAVATGLTIG